MLKHPREAFVDAATVEAQWRALNFTAAPDLSRAFAEYDRFVELISSTGAEIRFLPRDDRTTLDSIYVRDASFACDDGIILCAMGKPLRSAEPGAQGEVFQASGNPSLRIAGHVEAPGRLEGGDIFWLDTRTVAVGLGYRTNLAGIEQLRAILGNEVDEPIVVPLPHWRGEGDVMHLMSLISPVADDLAVVYSPLLPVPFRQQLLARGLTLIEVPHDEFETMGTNVLALAPRHCLMVAGNPCTRRALERAGAEVLEYEGREISLKGGGGPTCLTRPVRRDVGD